METINDRIKILRKELGLTLEKFGAILGVGKNAISRIETGKNGVTDQMFKSICREFNVNEIWLRDGIAPMLVELSQQEATMKAAANLLKDNESSIAKSIKTFLIVYDQLDASHKKALEDFYNLYLENLKKNQ